MARRTYSDIEQLIDTPSVIDNAESKWRDKQLNKNRFAKFLDRFIKLALPVIAFVFFIQTAPHTASMANRITKGAGVIAPVGFEFFIFIISVAIDRGLNKDGLKFFYYVVISLTAVLTIGGGFFSVLEQSGQTEYATMSAGEIVNTFSSMPFIDQFLLLFVVPYSIFATLSAKVLAEISLGIVLGEITLNSVGEDIELRWLEARFSIYKNALYIEATKHGMPMSLSERWATRKSVSLTNIVESDSSRTSPEQSTKSSSPSAINASPPELGFVTTMNLQNLAGRGLDNTGQSINGQSLKMSKAIAIIWAEKNQDQIEAIRERGLTKRQTAQVIAVEMGFDAMSYKTVERYIL